MKVTEVLFEFGQAWAAANAERVMWRTSCCEGFVKGRFLRGFLLCALWHGACIS